MKIRQKHLNLFAAAVTLIVVASAYGILHENNEGKRAWAYEVRGTSRHITKVRAAEVISRGENSISFKENGREISMYEVKIKPLY